MKTTISEVNVGGQAVIEGVMMRSEKFITVAVRKPDGRIALKREKNRSWLQRFKFFKLPLLRGGIVLIESLIHGIRALSWSADIAIEEEQDKKDNPSKDSWKAKLGIIFTLIIGLGMGLLLFMYIPLVLTTLFKFESSLMFNVIDGIFKIVIFGLYLLLISLWKEIRRIFQYHGAEHKSIYALENDCPLTIEGAKDFTTLHPRCGTSFLLIVIVASIMVFMLLRKPESVFDSIILVRMLFLPFIGGVAYEFIRFSGKHRNNPIARIFMMPGLWLQKVTTKEPTEEQLQVGLIALRSAIGEIVNDNNIVFYNENGEISRSAEGKHEESGIETGACEERDKR